MFVCNKRACLYDAKVICQFGMISLNSNKTVYSIELFVENSLYYTRPNNKLNWMCIANCIQKKLKRRNKLEWEKRNFMNSCPSFHFQNYANYEPNQTHPHTCHVRAHTFFRSEENVCPRIISQLRTAFSKNTIRKSLHMKMKYSIAMCINICSQKQCFRRNKISVLPSERF